MKDPIRIEHTGDNYMVVAIDPKLPTNMPYAQRIWRIVLKSDLTRKQAEWFANQFRKIIAIKPSVLHEIATDELDEQTKKEIFLNGFKE